MQKQTRLSEMPVAVLIITIVVMLGLLLGILYYFAANVAEFNPSIVITPIEKEVVIKTDKVEYEMGEDIYWHPQNYVLGELYLLEESCNKTYTTAPDLEKYENGDWRKVVWRNPANKLCGIAPSTNCARLKPDFNRVIKTKYIDFNNNEILLTGGTYRIKASFGKSCSQNKEEKTGELKDVSTVYSNEFTIKEKIAQNQDVYISTDKSEYELGEEITATLNYEGKINQWDPWSIQKLENNTWVDIQIKGDPYFLCANIPECKDVNLEAVEECPSLMLCERSSWYQVINTPKLAWDQSYKIEEKDFSCNFIQRHPVTKEITSSKKEDKSCAVFDQVPSGNYKIRFEYATDVDIDDSFSRKVDIKYAEKEFTIKEKTATNPDEDICDVGKGDADWDEIEGIFTENNSEYAKIKSECQQKNGCQWKSSGGEITSHYACCPNDYESSENEKVQLRCLISID